MFDRDRGPLIEYLKTKFGAKSDKLVEANIAALNAGHAYGETAEIGQPLKQVRVPPRRDGAGSLPHGDRQRDASRSAWWPAASLPDCRCSSAPIRSRRRARSCITLSQLKEYDVTRSRPRTRSRRSARRSAPPMPANSASRRRRGRASRSRARRSASPSCPNCRWSSSIVQRGGPSTGLPTKTEQSDLYQAVYGRNGDAPLVVIAARSPSDCFEVAIEAVRLAVQFMTPVMLLTDGYIANAAEPWRVPDMYGVPAVPGRVLRARCRPKAGSIRISAIRRP